MGRPTIKKFLKPYALKLFFSNKNVSAQVVHTPSSHTVVAASTQEELLRPNVATYADEAAAAEIGVVLAARLVANDLPAVSFRLERGQRYHGKRKVLLDSLRENGIKLL